MRDNNRINNETDNDKTKRNKKIRRIGEMKKIMIKQREIIRKEETK